MLLLVVLFTAGAAWSQMSMGGYQNPVAWGGSSQSAAGGGDDRSQTGSSSSSPTDNPAQNGIQTSQSGIQTSDDTAGQSSSDSSSQTPVNLSGNGASDGTTDLSASDTSPQTTINGPANQNVSVGGVGISSPLQIQSGGVKIGPVYLTSISDSFFYVVNTAPGQPRSTFTGDSIFANLVYSKQIGGGSLTIDGKEQFSLSELTPYFNQSVSANYTDQLTERWSLNASAQFIYFQNSILANPQYLLSYQNGGPVVQTLFAIQRAYSLYESNSISFSYQLNGRTHLTLTPIVSATILDQNNSWTTGEQFGGAVGVTRDVTDNLNVGGFYFFSHSLTSGVPNSPGWNTQSLGVSLQYRLRNSWFFAGSLAASGQLVAQGWQLTPTGSVAVRKAFTNSSIYGAYSRAEASTVFASSGYFDQGDVGYQRNFGQNQKLMVNVFAGEFRTVDAGLQQEGKRVGGAITYRWKPRVSVNAGYNFARQTGADTLTFSPLLGNTSAVSFGLNWALGSSSGP
jgi:hypothetical protein